MKVKPVSAFNGSTVRVFLFQPRSLKRACAISWMMIELEALRAVFAHWVQYDRENCDLVRQGLPIFRMPASYTVNETVKLRAVAEQGNTAPPPMLLQRGMLRLAEALQCVGGLHGNRGDRAFALEAALLLDRLQTKYPEVFEDTLLWRHRVPGGLGQVVLWGRLKRKEKREIVIYMRVWRLSRT